MFKFDLLEGEQVTQIYRQSEAVLFKPVVVVLVLIYIPWYLLLASDLATDYLRILLLWTVLVFLYAAYKYLLWLLNTYLVTSRRLISISYFGLFSKRILETPLSKILNVGFSTSGFWQTLFKFGNVEVVVPGLHEPMLLKNVSHPSQIKDVLWRAHALDSATVPQNPGK